MNAMNTSKRSRLAKRGWTVGSVDDFLGLSAEEATFVEMKVSLAEALRHRRARHGWTQQQLAEALTTSQSRVAKMEAADASVSLDLLVRSLVAMGASAKEVSRAISPSRRSAA